MRLTTIIISAKNWTKWKWATFLYLISLLLYIIACLNYGSAAMRIEIGTLVFGIIPVYIVLFWSLDETRRGTQEQIETLQELTSKQINALKDSTKLQIESFSTQIQGIVSALEQVVATNAQISEDIRKRMEQEKKTLETIKKQEETRLHTQELEAQKDLEKKQRIAPRVFVRIADEPWLLFFKHYRLYIFNSGGPLKNMEVTYFFLSQSYTTAKRTFSIASLNRGQGSRPIDCGDVTAFNAYTAIQISISLRDKEERLYVGTTTIDKSNREWVRISLEERLGE